MLRKRLRSSGGLWLALVLLVPGQVRAQSAITQVPRPATPYVTLYSPCRETPPDDPQAREFHQLVTRGDSLPELLRLLDRLRLLPVERLTAIEAEIHLLLPRQIEFQMSLDAARGDARGAWVTAPILDARERGRVIAQRFRDDSLVRCAWLSTELWLANSASMRTRFSADERDAARTEFAEFIEGALEGRVRTEASPYLLHDTVGQIDLDLGYTRLQRANAQVEAARWIETGAGHLLRAAALARDERHVKNWTRYEFMLRKLPLARQHDISQRLVAQADAGWARQAEDSPAVASTYLHLLSTAGAIALAHGKPREAVSIHERHLKLVQELRRREPDDPNHEVNEALGHLQLGDARKAAGDRAAAAQAYRQAERAEASASADARLLLKEQDFAEELARRRKSMR